MKIVFASGNKHKIEEFTAIVKKFIPDIEIASMKEVGIFDDIVEDGATFEENALIKARAVAKYGFDQGKELCVQIAAGFGQKPYYLFARVGGKEQKKLDQTKRSKNVDHAIILNTSAKKKPKCESVESLHDTIKGKTVVVIDDVITSGATVKRAVELLQSAGAERVFVSCVAKTKLKGKTK